MPERLGQALEIPLPRTACVVAETYQAGIKPCALRGVDEMTAGIVGVVDRVQSGQLAHAGPVLIVGHGRRHPTRRARGVKLREIPQGRGSLRTDHDYPGSALPHLSLYRLLDPLSSFVAALVAL